MSRWQALTSKTGSTHRFTPYAPPQFVSFVTCHFGRVSCWLSPHHHIMKNVTVYPINLWQKLDGSQSAIQICSSLVPFLLWDSLQQLIHYKSFHKLIHNPYIWLWLVRMDEVCSWQAPPPPEGYWRVGWSRGDRCALQRRVLGPWVRVALEGPEPTNPYY